MNSGKSLPVCIDLKPFYEEMVKRLFDIFGAVVILVVLSPVIAVSMLWIRIDSGKGVIFRQRRIGRFGEPFTILKLRTMSHSGNGLYVSCGKSDSRITRSGHFLRKWKIDELPQLLNVIKGDMSLVGPRPEVQHYQEFYTSGKDEIYSIRPGLTDYASIEFRNEETLLEGKENPEQYYIEEILPRKIELQLRYVRNRSIREDIKILWHTLRVCLTGDNGDMEN